MKFKTLCTCLALLYAGDAIAGDFDPLKQGVNENVRKMEWNDHDESKKKVKRNVSNEGYHLPISVDNLPFISDDLSVSVINFTVHDRWTEQHKKKLSILLSKYLNLEELNLSGCAELPNSIGKLTNLEKLDLSGCKNLTELPDSIGKLTNLEKLDLSRCKNLMRLPESFGNLANLKELNFGGCKSLTELSESFGNLANLEELNFEGCESLTKLPESFGNLTNLRELDFGKFRYLTDFERFRSDECESLTELPESFGNLANLKELNFDGCINLTKLPESSGNLTNLEELNLSGCGNLTELPRNFGNLTNLKSLSLNECDELTELPDSFSSLTNLIDLNLRWCESLTRLPDGIGNLTNLKELNLKFCKKLKKLPKEVGNLVNLSELYFYGSGIRDLPISEDSTESSEEDGSEWSFSEDDSIIDGFQKDILDLNFSGKNIDTNLFGIVLYSNLEELDLSNTNLEELPALMVQLQKLKKLNLGKNPGINSVDKVHDAIFGLPELESIKLTENGEDREYNKEEIAEIRENRIENLEEELKKIPYGRGNLTNDQRNEFIKEYLFDRKYQRKIDEKIFKDRLQRYQETFAQWRAKKVLLSKLKAAQQSNLLSE